MGEPGQVVNANAVLFAMYQVFCLLTIESRAIQPRFGVPE